MNTTTHTGTETELPPLASVVSAEFFFNDDDTATAVYLMSDGTRRSRIIHNSDDS